eukprot:UN04735
MKNHNILIIFGLRFEVCKDDTSLRKCVNLKHPGHAYPGNIGQIDLVYSYYELGLVLQ